MLQFLLLSVDALLNESPIRSKALAPALVNDKAEGSEQNRQRVGGEGQKSQIRIEKPWLHAVLPSLVRAATANYR